MRPLLLAVLVAALGCGGSDEQQAVRVSLDEWQAGDCSSADFVVTDASGTVCTWACASFQTPLGWYTVPGGWEVHYLADGTFDHSVRSDDCR